MPPIGRPESYYAKLAHAAEQNGDAHAHEAAKVGQYVTLAMDAGLPWEEKLKYLKHAIKRHCQAPSFADEDVWMFYQQMADHVRQHAGAEALRIASREDDLYAARLSMGQERQQIEEDAETFFSKLIVSEDKPDWFNEVDWVQLKLIRDQWI
jgi:hypothetical protein